MAAVADRTNVNILIIMLLLQQEHQWNIPTCGPVDKLRHYDNSNKIFCSYRFQVDTHFIIFLLDIIEMNKILVTRFLEITLRNANLQ
jgi:hypothetical protein